MNPAPRKRIKWIAGIICGLGILAFLLGPGRPRCILALAAFQEDAGEEGERNGQQTRDQLIACGSSAITPTIDAIRRTGPWFRGESAYLPQVLAGLGEPARHALLASIESEKDSRARAHLIFALQAGFSDYSRLDLWLAEASSGAATPLQLLFFAADVRRRFPDAPDLAVKDQLNPDFMEWWRTSKPTKI